MVKMLKFHESKGEELKASFDKLIVAVGRNLIQLIFRWSFLTELDELGRVQVDDFVKQIMKIFMLLVRLK